jgi:IS30 family transposase
LVEREEISRGVVAGHSLRFIAASLNRAPSTVSREIKRNGGRRHYRACKADEASWDRAHRAKRCKLAQNPALAYIVAEKLQLEWSPDQIAGWLKSTYPNDEGYQVSHETIYKSLFVQTRGVLKKELIQYLRRPRAMRRSRHHTQKTKDHGRISNTVSIRERPPEAEDRAVPGHWEGDLICGSNNSQIATLVERHTRYVMLVRVPSKDTKTVINALIKHAHKLPRELYKSLTWDRGKEMADHTRFSLDTDINVFFCDPQSPWQRGSNENTNGLLRQYFPKGMDLSNVHQKPIKCGRTTTQRATKKDVRISNTGRTFCSMCCVDRLMSQSKAGPAGLAICSHQDHRLFRRIEVTLRCGEVIRIDRRAYGWLRTLLSHAVSGSQSDQSGQARYSGNSKIPMPRVYART